MKELYKIIIINIIVALVSMSLTYLIVNQMTISSIKAANLRIIPTIFNIKLDDFNSISFECFVQRNFLDGCGEKLHKLQSTHVAFMGCSFFCNLNYSQIKNLTQLQGGELWIYKFGSFIETIPLSSSKNWEQMSYYLNQSGEYSVELWNPPEFQQKTGYFRYSLFKFYAYDTLEEYTSRLTDVQQNNLNFISGIILFAIGIVVGILIDYFRKENQINLDSKKYTIRVYPKKITKKIKKTSKNLKTNKRAF